MHAHEDDVVARQHVQAVGEPPRLAEHVVDDDVVTARRHPGDGPVEPHPCPPQHIAQVLRCDLHLGPHRIEGVHGEVEEWAVEYPQQLGCQRRLTRTRRPVQENDQGHRQIVQLGRPEVNFGTVRRARFTSRSMPPLGTWIDADDQ